MEGEIINKVQKSSLVSFDLEQLVDNHTTRFTIDLKKVLYQGLVLREKDFRAFIKEHNWDQYRGAYVNLTCSEEAIIPNWAFMLMASKLTGLAKLVIQGSSNELEKEVLRLRINSLNYNEFLNAKIVLKGCSEISHPEFAFTELTLKLTPYVSSLMYGEPCSTVPVYKAKK